MILRDYQQASKDSIYDAWERVRNVIAVAPTGSGKTVVFSSILAESKGLSVAIAHRREILGQISLALAVNGVPHSIVGPAKAAREFAKRHREEVGRSWIDPRASVCVASVDTLKARESTLKAWGAQCRLWVQDEAHHVLEDNKWGSVTRLFPNAKGLGVTAHPKRTDGRSLALGEGGVFEELIQGPSQRDLINQGYLTDYRIFAPSSDMHLENLKITVSGDYSRTQLAKVAHESHIVGDVVEHYLKIAPGLKGITFAIDVETAQAMAGRFRDKGVPALALDAKSTDTERYEGVSALRRREILQLVNVDLFGEGFDLPSIEVGIFARPTASWGLYRQQFGRVLRPFEGKTHGIIIDPVGNVMRHGLPDRPVLWSLQGGTSMEDKSGPPLRTCEECLRLWEGYSRECPHCGFTPTVELRSRPAEVEGDLSELDPQVLAQMRGEISRIDGPVPYLNGSEAAVRGLAANHRKRQVAQRGLRDTMALWGGHAKADGLTESARQIKFYRQFGVDVLSAQALGRPLAEKLTNKVKGDLG